MIAAGNLVFPGKMHRPEEGREREQLGNTAKGDAAKFHSLVEGPVRFDHVNV